MGKIRVIYGTGDYGKKLYGILENWGVSVDFFCRTEVPERTGKQFGLEILPLEKLVELPDKKVILIAIENAQISRKIKLNLMNLLDENDAVYECGMLIKNNQYAASLSEKQYCILCNSCVKGFLPSGTREGVFGEHYIIGGGFRKNVICPICGSMDRARWSLYILKKYTKIFTEQCRVLHFAPEEKIAERLKANDKCDYYMCDIKAGGEIHGVDITDIMFRDNMFDYIIVNHVLEHVEDEKQAIGELTRILKADGKLILSFPICMDQKTFENKDIVTKEERLKYYGQEDHVRLYGNDYKERLEGYGLKVDIYSPRNEFSGKDAEKYGFIYDDIAMICKIL